MNFVGILSKTGSKGEGKSTIRLIAERQVIIYAAVLIGGVGGGIWLDDRGLNVVTSMVARLPGAVAIILGITALLGAVMIPWRPPAIFTQYWRWKFAPVLSVAVVWLALGGVAVQFQLAGLPDAIEQDRVDLRLSGQVERLDGRQDGRLRVWMRVHQTDSHQSPQAGSIASAIRGHIVRLSYDPQKFRFEVGQPLSVVARIYPPPGRVLAGLSDYSVRARAGDVVASGYIRSVASVGQHSGPSSWSVTLSRMRQQRADRITAAMVHPAGGIAAALLIGDRRHVSQHTYDLFRESGLAHLLAISGLHMGLLCFGVIAALRRFGALFPAWASRQPLHKFAACGGLVAGLLYVVLSGASVSAVRAYLMALLVILSWLIDRPGVTLRNVGIAAIIVVIVNPLAILTAGFQLSFAATAGLVIWYDRATNTAHANANPNPNPNPNANTSGPQDNQVPAGQSTENQPPGRHIWPRGMRWAGGLFVASLIASLSTLPLTAQHFGAVTPWGVMANLLGIPLTGLWIMPAGLAVLLCEFLPVPQILAQASLTIMQTGIQLLVEIASWFAGQALAPVYVSPPGWLTLAPLGLTCLVPACFHMRWRMRWALIVLCTMVTGITATLRPATDAVLLFQGETPILVLPLPEGRASIHMPSDMRRSGISAFLSEHAARVLGLAPTTPRLNRRWLHLVFRDVTTAVVTHRGRLSDSCDSDADLILSLVKADYPCRSGVPLYRLDNVKPANYLIAYEPEGLKLTAPDGQYLRIKPVRRP